MLADDDARRRLERAVERLEAAADLRRSATVPEVKVSDREWVEFLADHPELTEGRSD